MRYKTFLLGSLLLLGASAAHAYSNDDWEAPVAGRLGQSAECRATEIVANKKATDKKRQSCSKASSRFRALKQRKASRGAIRRAAKESDKACNSYQQSKAGTDALLSLCPDVQQFTPAAATQETVGPFETAN